MAAQAGTEGKSVPLQLQEAPALSSVSLRLLGRTSPPPPPPPPHEEVLGHSRSEGSVALVTACRATSDRPHNTQGRARRGPGPQRGATPGTPLHLRLHAQQLQPCGNQVCPAPRCCCHSTGPVSAAGTLLSVRQPDAERRRCPGFAVLQELRLGVAKEPRTPSVVPLAGGSSCWRSPSRGLGCPPAGRCR